MSFHQFGPVDANRWWSVEISVPNQNKCCHVVFFNMSADFGASKSMEVDGLVYSFNLLTLALDLVFVCYQFSTIGNFNSDI